MRFGGNKVMNEKIKDTIQDCNINFLIGSGVSSPYLKLLGSIEILLTQLEEKELNSNKRKLIKASLYKKYFDDVISKNLKILESNEEARDVLNNYYNFLKTINSILLKRKSTILSKEVNIFTTNIDIFLEKAIEDLGLEYNDGFNGRFRPSFSLSNFKKSHFKKSLHYDNTSELPVFNLLKLHGSLTWEIAEKGRILFSSDLNPIKKIQSKEVSAGNILEISNSATIDTLITDSEGKTPDSSLDEFLQAYDKLLIVNPTKEKFKHTLLNQTYYELLRIFSNELEKENTVLFVMGFSFADEHIREIILRAANSNPTLMIYVIAHSSKSKTEIETIFGVNTIKNNNMEIIAPPQKKPAVGGTEEDEFKYDFSIINREIFCKIIEKEETDNLPTTTAGTPQS